MAIRLVRQEAERSKVHNLSILMVLTYKLQWKSKSPNQPSYSPTLPVVSRALRFGRVNKLREGGPRGLRGRTRRRANARGNFARGYQILKEVDPNCIVVSPVATDRDGWNLLDACLAGGGKYADVIDRLSNCRQRSS